MSAQTYTFTHISSSASVTGEAHEAEAPVRAWFPDASANTEQWLDDLFLQLRGDRLDEPAATALGLTVTGARN